MRRGTSYQWNKVIKSIFEFNYFILSIEVTVLTLFSYISGKPL